MGSFWIFKHTCLGGGFFLGGAFSTFVCVCKSCRFPAASFHVLKCCIFRKRDILPMQDVVQRVLLFIVPFGFPLRKNACVIFRWQLREFLVLKLVL